MGKSIAKPPRQLSIILPPELSEWVAAEIVRRSTAERRAVTAAEVIRSALWAAKENGDR